MGYSESEELLMAQKALVAGELTQAQLEECIQIRHKLREMGLKDKPLLEILTEKGYLDRQYLRKLVPQSLSAAAMLENFAQNPFCLQGYEILEKLGKGAVGTVYKARQISMDRLVAIKVLDPTLAEDSQYVERFKLEARAVAKLNHPNIISGITVEEIAGLHFFVMEYVDGRTVGEILDEQSCMPEEQVLDIMLQMAQALEHAHSKNIIHRDIKPDNIMLSHSNIAKLCDLGLAFIQGKARLTLVGGLVGTPQYISPEQAQGLEKIDARTDIYSFGATLYHMVTGAVPYPESNPLVVCTMHITRPFPNPLKKKPDLSEATAQIIMRCTRKEPAQRYQSAAELVQDLKRAQQLLLTPTAEVVSTPPRPATEDTPTVVFNSEEDFRLIPIEEEQPVGGNPEGPLPAIPVEEAATETDGFIIESVAYHEPLPAAPPVARAPCTPAQDANSPDQAVTRRPAKATRPAARSASTRRPVARGTKDSAKRKGSVRRRAMPTASLGDTGCHAVPRQALSGTRSHAIGSSKLPLGDTDIKRVSHRLTSSSTRAHRISSPNRRNFKPWVQLLLILLLMATTVMAVIYWSIPALYQQTWSWLQQRYQATMGPKIATSQPNPSDHLVTEFIRKLEIEADSCFTSLNARAAAALAQDNLALALKIYQGVPNDMSYPGFPSYLYWTNAGQKCLDLINNLRQNMAIIYQRLSRQAAAAYARRDYDQALQLYQQLQTKAPLSNLNHIRTCIDKIKREQTLQHSLLGPIFRGHLESQDHNQITISYDFTDPEQLQDFRTKELPLENYWVIDQGQLRGGGSAGLYWKAPVNGGLKLECKIRLLSTKATNIGLSLYRTTLTQPRHFLFFLNYNLSAVLKTYLPWAAGPRRQLSHIFSTEERLLDLLSQSRLCRQIRNLFVQQGHALAANAYLAKPTTVGEWTIAQSGAPQYLIRQNGRRFDIYQYQPITEHPTHAIVQLQLSRLHHLNDKHAPLILAQTSRPSLRCGQTYLLTIEVQPQQGLMCWHINGQLVKALLPDHNLLRGYLGIYAWGSEACFDDLKITAYVQTAWLESVLQHRQNKRR